MMKLHGAAQFLVFACLSMLLLPLKGVTADPESVGRVAATRFHPYFAKASYGMSSALYLANPSESPAVVALDFHSLMGGTPFSDIVGPIPPHGVLRRTGDDFPSLPLGTYSLVVTSDQSVQSVVRSERASTARSLFTYRGQSEGNTTLYFGPVYKNAAGWNASITLLNTGPAAASVSINYISNDGMPVFTSVVTIPALIGYSVYMPAIPLPNGFQGWVRVTSDQPLIGILGLSNTLIGSDTEMRTALDTQAALPCIPRALKHTDQGSGPRSTTLFISNTGVTAAEALLSFFNADGTLAASTGFTLPAGGASTVRLADLDSLPATGSWAACIPDGRGLLIGELTTHDSAGAAYDATYDAPSTSDLDRPFGAVLPRLVRGDTAHTVFTLQNTGSADGKITVRLRDLTGALVYTDTLVLRPGAWKRYDQSQMPHLSLGFEGVGEIASDQPLAVLVDELVLPQTSTPIPTVTSTQSLTPTAMSTATPTRTATPTLTPTRTSTPTRTRIPRSTPGSIFLPLVLRQLPLTPTPTPTVPPFPAVPALDPITPPEANPSYTVRWAAAARAESYVLERTTDAGFGDAAQVYAGTATEYIATGAGIATYYYRAKAHNGGGDSGWSNLQAVEVRWELEPNGEAVDATGPLQTGLFYYGVLASASDVKDYFYFELAMPRNVNFDLTNMVLGQDFDLVLRDADLTQLGYSGKLGSADEHISASLSAGRYYVQVYRRSGDVARPYHLRAMW